MSKTVLLIAGVILFLLFILVYGFIDPAASSFFPKCPFLSLTGLQCPGCGSQRAVHQLINGNFSQAFFFNPLLILAIPYMLLGVLFEFPFFRNSYPRIERFLFSSKSINIVLVIIIAFWIFRNVF